MAWVKYRTISIIVFIPVKQISSQGKDLEMISSICLHLQAERQDRRSIDGYEPDCLECRKPSHTQPGLGQTQASPVQKI